MIDLPRDKMILFIAGHFLDKTNTWKDMIIAVDNFLTSRNQPCMSKEERKFFEEVYDQIWVLMKTAGHNRQMIRKMARDGKKMK